jgi:hypothetical protein
MDMKRILVLVSAIAILSLLLTGFANTFVLNIFSGRVHFPEKYIGRNLTMEDDKKYVVFRRLKISDKNHIDSDPSVFKARFRFKSLKPSINIC